MSKFKCKECDKELELDQHTMKVVDGLVVSPDAICCDDYMASIINTSDGFGGIILKEGGKVGGKF
jgi:hypothetical protein